MSILPRSNIESSYLYFMPENTSTEVRLLIGSLHLKMVLQGDKTGSHVDETLHLTASFFNLKSVDLNGLILLAY